MSKYTCTMRTSAEKSGVICWKDAAFGIYWVQNGEDEIHSCALHLAKAVRKVTKLREASTVKVRVLST